MTCENERFSIFYMKETWLEHLTLPKFPPSNKDKDGKTIDAANVWYQESLLAYQH